MPLSPAEVHQAEGMILAQLDVDIDTARERLHAHATAEHRDLVDVANDILAGRLRLDPA